MASDGQAFFGLIFGSYLIIWIIGILINFAWIYCIYYCCTKHILNKVSNQQFDKLVTRHEATSNQIGELRQSKAQHDIALKHLQKDLQELKSVNRKTQQKVDNLFNRLNGSRIGNTVSQETLDIQKQPESGSSHDD